MISTSVRLKLLGSEILPIVKQVMHTQAQPKRGGRVSLELTLQYLILIHKKSLLTHYLMKKVFKIFSKNKIFLEVK